MQKRMVFALILSLAVLITFQYFFKISPTNIAKQKSYEQSVEEKRITPGERTTEEVLPEKEVKSFSEKAIFIQTEKYEIVFSNVGGSITQWRMKEFENEPDPELEQEEKEILIKTKSPGKQLFAMQSQMLRGLESKRFEARQGQDYLEYIYEKPGAFRITKRYNFHNINDYIGLSIAIKNLSSEIAGFSYQLTGPAGMQETGAVHGRSFLQAEALIDDTLIRKHSVKGMWVQQGNISWIALKNRYFAAILKPFENPMYAMIEGNRKIGLDTFLKTKDYTLSPGQTIEEDYLLYMGPIDGKRLKAVGYGMEQIVDYGWFGAISKVLLIILRFFHRWVKNWGLAIILLTLVVNILTFPLTRKSFMSMHQMKNVQPHMQKLKELHKDNPQKLNKEMMELYKTYNVNPFGGCLPMLLQIPIFIALYQGLIRSIELKGAHFLWIKDLAKPDAAPLPFTLPVIGNHINILPLLMAGMMFLQQKITQGATTAAMTDDQAKQQKMMMFMMPLFFGFLFYNMPSGLVLYWLTNTILMSSEQALLTKTMK